MRTVTMLLLGLLLTALARSETPRVVMAYPREFLNVAPKDGRVTVGPIELSLIGTLPQSITNRDLRWQADWDGLSPLDALPTLYSGRTVSASISIPIAAFTPANNFTVAFQPRVFFGNISAFLALGDWIVLTISSPPAPAAPRLVSGNYYLGYGATPVGKDRSLHAQKTDIAKVDVDRPPLINPTTNPTFDLSQDGLTEQGAGDAEDTSLFPRMFTIHPIDENGNKFAYAELTVSSPTLIFHPLDASNAANGDYNDRTKGIDGRRTDAPGEPVRIFTLIGERVANVGSVATDGKRLLFTGPLGRGK